MYKSSLLLSCKVQHIAMGLHQVLEQGLWVLNSAFRKYQKLEVIFYTDNSEPIFKLMIIFKPSDNNDNDNKSHLLSTYSAPYSM